MFQFQRQRVGVEPVVELERHLTHVLATHFVLERRQTLVERQRLLRSLNRTIRPPLLFVQIRVQFHLQLLLHLRQFNRQLQFLLVVAGDHYFSDYLKVVQPSVF